MAAPRRAAKAAPATPSPLVGEGVGRIAYEAYSAAVDGVSVHGEGLPSWRDHLENNPHVARAWCVAAQAVLTATFARKD